MPSNLIVMSPLLPGKQEAWRQFCQTLEGSRRHEYSGSLQRMGITKQKVWLSQTQQMDLVHLHLQMDQGARAMTALASSTRPFDRWLRKQVRDLHGLDLKQLAQSVPELILVWPPAPIAAAVQDDQ